LDELRGSGFVTSLVTDEAQPGQRAFDQLAL
jgi:hypothetical protein